MKKLAGIAAGLLLCGYTALSGDEMHSVRTRFVPASDGLTPQSYGGVTNWAQLGRLDEAAWNEGGVPVPTGADWTRLGPGPGKEAGVLFLMAHAGVGDAFPVQDSSGRTHFVVMVADGDDAHLLLVVRSKEGSQGIDVRRDKPVPVVVAGRKYELLFPTVAVAAAADAAPTTDKAMIIVRHRP